jgi:hypothetical protein
VERLGGGSTTFTEIGTSTGTSFSNSGLAAATAYSYRVRAADAAGNLSTYSALASATTQAPAPGGGLVAAYSFDEGGGTTVADASGNGNAGTIGSATWTTAGKNGGALAFNGTSARVRVNDAPSLDLSTAMTLAAWVRPSNVSGSWRDVIFKGDDMYYLEATSPPGRPAMGGTFSGGPLYGPSSLPVNTWTHLAASYDGATLRLYVNGLAVASRVRTGPIATSNLALEIGGDSIYGQFFAGTIDDVRIYSRALSASEIQSAMNTPVQ